MNTYFWQIFNLIDMVLLNVLVSLASLSVTLIMCKKKKKDLNVSKPVLLRKDPIVPQDPNTLGSANKGASVNRNVKKCDQSVVDLNKYPKTKTIKQPSVKVSSTPVSQPIPPSSEKSLKTSESPPRQELNEEEFKKELLAYEREVRKEWAKTVPWMLEIEKEIDIDSINLTPSKSTEKPQATVKTDKNTDKPKVTPKSKERAKSKTNKAKKEVKKSLKDSKRSKDQKKMEKVEKEEEIRVKLMDDPPGENEEEQSATRLSELYSGQLKLTN